MLHPVGHKSVMSSSTWITTFLLFYFTIFNVKAKLSCTFTSNNQQNVACTAEEDADNVVNKGVLKNITRAAFISLRGCKITYVDTESFFDLDSLISIDLSDNKITNLRLDTFDGASRVMHLNLSHNSVQLLPSGPFQRLYNLETLFLNDNMIDCIERTTFNSLRKLKHLDLSGNSLLGVTIHPSLFDRPQHLKTLILSRNNLQGVSNDILKDLLALETLDLDNCQLTEVPQLMGSNLRTLKHLSMASNHIVELKDPDDFMNLVNLEILDLNGNKIESIDSNEFKRLEKLKVLNLRRNRVKVIPDILFQETGKLGNIDLSHNLIENVPVDALRRMPSLKNLNLSANKFTYLQDNFLLELKNSGVTLKKFYFHQNPWQCACLNQLLKEVKSFGVDYNAVKFNGDNPVCIIGDEFNCQKHERFNEYFIDMYEYVIRKHVKS